jgi:hypothetical protein
MKLMRNNVIPGGCGDAEGIPHTGLRRAVKVASAIVALSWVWAQPAAAAGPIFGYLPFSVTKVFFEQNATDGDLGLHLKADGEGWERLILTDSRFRILADVRVRGNLGSVIGLTEIFSESAEPSFDEMPPEEFLSLFPEGYYFYFARTVDRHWLLGVTRLTHLLPGEPELLSPGEDEVIDPGSDLTLEWVPVDDPKAPASVIEFYEVVVAKEEEGEMERVFSVQMLPTDSAVRVPAEFFEPGKDYKVEIIAQETSGNRTAIEVPFSTAGDDGEGEEE